MRIVTLNTWKNEGDYDDRLGAMAVGLRALDADVIALQECFVAPDLGFDTAAYLATATGLHLTSRPMRAKHRDHGGVGTPSRSDLVLLTRSAPLAVGGGAYPDEPRDRDRGLLFIDIEVDRTKMRLGCTHLTHIRDEAAALVRKSQAGAALSLLRGGHEGPVILIDDLNALPGDDCLSPLFDDPALDPASRDAAFAALALWPSPSRVVSGHIDHVLLFDAHNRIDFAGRSVALVADHEHLHLGPSDHPAIIADMEIR